MDFNLEANKTTTLIGWPCMNQSVWVSSAAAAAAGWCRDSESFSPPPCGAPGPTDHVGVGLGVVESRAEVMRR